MANITAVASACLSGVQPRYGVQGVQAVYSVYSLTATLSAGDIIRICKIPDGARIIDVQVGVPGVVCDTGRINVGTASDHDQFIVSATINVARVINMSTHGDGAAFGTVLGTSDSASTKYTELRAKISDNATSGTGTNAGTIRFLVTYHSPEPY